MKITIDINYVIEEGWTADYCIDDEMTYLVQSYDTREQAFDYVTGFIRDYELKKLSDSSATMS